VFRLTNKMLPYGEKAWLRSLMGRHVMDVVSHFEFVVILGGPVLSVRPYFSLTIISTLDNWAMECHLYVLNLFFKYAS